MYETGITAWIERHPRTGSTGIRAERSLRITNAVEPIAIEPLTVVVIRIEVTALIPTNGIM